MKLSIVIPIYNASNYLEEALQSIIRQKKINSIPIEILMVDDGSVDRSATICERYAEEDSRFKYICKVNEGVSSARNSGMKLAQGEYILFLDADDKLEEMTIATVVKTFDKYNDKANILAYPLYTMTSEKIEKHARHNVYKKEGIFNVEISPYINQCTMNIVIKNLPNSEKIWFDTELKQSEDALFNTQMILTTKNIIIASSGGYYYRKDVYSTVDKYKNPVDIKNMLLDFFEALTSLSNNSGNLSMYVQSMILYEINWRFVQNVFYPNHLDRKSYSIWHNRLLQIFTYIDAETIINQPFMDYYHKCYFIEQLKGGVTQDVDSSGAIIKVANRQIAKVNKITLVFTKIKFIDNGIHFEGFIKMPFEKLSNILSFEVENDKKHSEKINLVYTPSSYYKAKIKTANFKGFSFDILYSEAKEYYFNVRLGGISQNTTYYFGNSVVFKKHLKSPVVKHKDKVISYTNNPFTLKIESANDLTSKSKLEIKKQKRNLKLTQNKNIRRVISIEKLFKPLIKNKKIWLYNDRETVMDNAYFQFKHDFRVKDAVSRFYVVYGYKRRDIGIPFKYQVIYGSIKHKLLFINSSMIITSFKDFTEYSPISYRLFNTLYSELKFKLIYVQHGVLHAHTPWLYSKYKTNFDYYVISGESEKSNLISNYGYNDSDLIEAGMPRFDSQSEYRDIPNDKKILYAPSWRKSLVIEENNKLRKLNLEALEASVFYKSVVELIGNQKLSKVLKENNYTLDIKLHPIFLETEKLFDSANPRINIVQPGEIVNEKEYNLFVTDYSSYVFDFIKQNIPVTFLFTDKDYFESGSHIYTQLDFDLSDFGPEYRNVESFVEYVEKNIEKDFHTINNKKKAPDFFFDLDGMKVTDIIYGKLRDIE